VDEIDLEFLTPDSGVEKRSRLAGKIAGPTSGTSAGPTLLDKAMWLVLII
jgi:hypothetical protein